jgi:IPT/TIG domain
VANPNTIVSIDPVTGTISSAIAAGIDPHFLALSSDASYLWTALDGANSIQRFLLPGLTKDISFLLPDGQPASYPGTVSSLQAAPVNPHTLAFALGTSGGIFVYDDAVQRPISVPNWEPAGGPFINWIQWGKDDSTIYGNQTETIDAGGIATIAVNSSGASLTSYPDSLLLQPLTTQFDGDNGILYSYGGAYDPTKPTMVGQFDMNPDSDYVCTADSSLDRYFCVDVYSLGGSDVFNVELWVFDLNTYALLGADLLGSLQGESGGNQPNSLITGAPRKLVRWGKAGLALITTSGAELGIPPSQAPYGAGGVFLIDGGLINPNSAPDSISGVALAKVYPWLTSMTPQAAAAGSGEVTVTITGTGFAPDSTACWDCSNLQFQLLPTTYVSSTELQVTVPVSQLPTTEPLEVSVYSASTNLFSTNALTFTVVPSSGTTQITPLNVSGLAMAWDANTELLYVGTADYDAAYPNSIVAVNLSDGAIVKSQAVGSDPYVLSDSADGQYLYVGYAGATNMTQLAMPSLSSPVTWPLNPVTGVGPGPYYAYDLKASPTDPHSAAVTYDDPWGADPAPTGYLGIYDDSGMRPTPAQGATFGALAWSNTDTNLASASPNGLSLVQVNSSGAALTGAGTTAMMLGELHSDFSTGLVYSDNGNVADPTTGALVGSYNAAGLLAPDSSLNRVFILGQTAAQINTNNYTIESFDEKGFTVVSSITLNNLSGYPIQMVRCGASGLAILTTGGAAYVYENGFGMLYLINDSKFVSNLPAASFVLPEKQELVQQRWKRLSKREALTLAHRAARKPPICRGLGFAPRH